MVIQVLYFFILRPLSFSLATTSEISVDFYSYSYLDVSVHCVIIIKYSINEWVSP